MKNIAIRKVINMNIERDEIYQVVSSKSECKETRNESIPSKSDIRNALQHSNLEDQAIILLMSSSGMGSEQIQYLTVGDFCDAISEPIGRVDFDMVKIGLILYCKENILGENFIATWNVISPKKGNRYCTFSTEESIKAITDYLIERQNRNGIIMSEREPLFENFQGKISETSFIKKFHALRKYFVSKLYQKGLSQINIDGLLGHGINGVNAEYITFDLSNLKEEYLNVVEDLSIEKVKVKILSFDETEKLGEELREEIKEISTRIKIMGEINEKRSLAIEEYKKNISVYL